GLIDEVPIERESPSAESTSALAPDPDPAPTSIPPAPGRDAPQAVTAGQPSAAVPVLPSWQIVLDDGTALALTASRVLLGRRPASNQEEQLLAVPDTTRTLSK